MNSDKVKPDNPELNFEWDPAGESDIAEKPRAYAADQINNFDSYFEFLSQFEISMAELKQVTISKHPFSLD